VLYNEFLSSILFIVFLKAIKNLIPLLYTNFMTLEVYMGLFDRSEGPQSSRFRPIFIALLIALFGFFMYISQTEENPVTGVKQHVSLTPSQEIRLGIESAPAMASEMGGEVSSTDPRAQKVQQIGQEIITRTEAHNGPWKFQFHLLRDNKTINAFALPGGQIFITLGLLNELQTEGQLAGVLAHEVGHVIQRHAAQQMAKGQLGQILIMATGVGASDSRNHGQEAAMIASVVNQMTQLHYGRGDELEADQWGLKLMTQAGYDPKAMLDVMMILKKATPGGGTPEMLLTHPYPETRIEYINKYLEEHPSTSKLSQGRPLNKGLERTNPLWEEESLYR
jgi:predicted Zn-dependent protease